jgi:hypothetical protein
MGQAPNARDKQMPNQYRHIYITGGFSLSLSLISLISQDIKGTGIETVPIYTSIISNSSSPCNIPPKGATLIGQTSRQLAESENFYFSHHFSPPRHAMPMPCHACLQMAVHDTRQKSDGKKARKTATSSGFGDLRWAPLPDACCRKAPQLGLIASVVLRLWAAASSDCSDLR